ncbi:MAG TPA: malto-oligosyltrehalose trehalohydrolase [Polyangiales bacterium]|nr:malto-oligosyltrehalose trehalohydrolase [Polyangiales bacterium]
MSSRLGAHVLSENRGIEFRVWAPSARTVELELIARGTRIEMSEHEGVFFCEAKDAFAGTDYRYVLDGDKARPDPRSRHQPDGVHGASRVLDPTQFLWSDAGFRCPSLHEFAIYELHIGTFSAEGTFDAAIPHLPHLVELGVTAVEIMPIAQFPGTRNWGYDGVFPFAVQSSYGGPEAFARLVDACHAHGLAVVLDVVYNHLGPEGNYLGEFGPYFSDHYKTDWGSPINFDGPDSDEVRRFFIDNALQWLRDYHVDALRLDAIHAIFDLSARHVLEEMRDEVEAQAAKLGRRAFLIAESDLNDSRVIRPVELGGYGLHAQWSDDFHHSLRTLLSPQRAGYLADFGKVGDLGHALTQGFVYSGQHSNYRRRRHGNSSIARPGQQFVVYQQNHDQIGNTAQGMRVSELVGFEKSKLSAVVTLAAPNLPLLFMGEEFFARTPFAYFVDHSDPELSEAVRKGRADEHALFQVEGGFIDPIAIETFDRCKLDWRALAGERERQMLQLYRDMIALRARNECLGNCDKSLTRATWNDDEHWLVLVRAAISGEVALCVFNFGDHARRVLPPNVRGRFRLALSTSDARYGGIGAGGHARFADIDGRDADPIELGPASAVIYLSAGEP